jgi:hypothetical protein
MWSFGASQSGTGARRRPRFAAEGAGPECAVAAGHKSCGPAGHGCPYHYLSGTNGQAIFVQSPACQLPTVTSWGILTNRHLRFETRFDVPTKEARTHRVEYGGIVACIAGWVAD